MENTKIVEIPTADDTMPFDGVVTVSADKLLQALYKIWDAFERANVPFFLVHQTAEDAMKQRDLTGDKVEVGVRRMEWISGGRRIIDGFITPVSEDKDAALYEFDGVPVIVHVYDDHECIIQTDMVRYRYEEFKVPNPYETFQKVFSK